jgi:hypothetical protein
MKPGRYKLVAVVKDAISKRVGIVERLVMIPASKDDPELELSPIILADLVQPARSGEFINDAFVLGAVRVYPNPQNSFSRGAPLGFYVEIYNIAADTQSLEPQLGLELDLRKDGKQVPLPFSNLERLLHAFGDRYYAGAMMSTAPLDSGRYRMTITVTDRIAGKAASSAAEFVLVDSTAAN